MWQITVAPALPKVAGDKHSAIDQQCCINKHTATFGKMQCLCRLLDGTDVTVQFGDVTETTDLVEGRHHTPTIKDIFALHVV